MSIKAILYSSLFAASALAGGYGGGSSGGESWGGSGGGAPGGPPMGEMGSGNGYSSWTPTQGAPGLAAASCPAGCTPIGAPPPMQTQPGQLIVQVVSVSDANGSLKYFPDKISAPVGSIVQFQFHPKNHTITESTFAEPCKAVPANISTSTRPGIKSGFVPVTGMEPFTPVYNVLVNDTKPIWLYCGQVNHCAKGMAMVINQNDTSGKTIEQYIQNAAQIPLVSVAAPPPPAGTPPPAFTAPPPPPPPAQTSSVAFGFGGGAPPASAAPPPPPVQTVAPPATPASVAPSIFTGAAAHNLAGSSTGAIAVVGALLAMW